MKKKTFQKKTIIEVNNNNCSLLTVFPFENNILSLVSHHKLSYTYIALGNRELLGLILLRSGEFLSKSVFLFLNCPCLYTYTVFISCSSDS